MTRPPNSLATDPVVYGRTFSKLSRPQNVLYSGLVACLAVYASGGSGWKAVACYGLLLILYAGAAVYNNLRDVRTDRLNARSDNPLVRGDIPKRAVRTFLWFCLGSALLLQYAVAQPSGLLLSAVYALLAWAYSHPQLKLMSRGFGGTVLLGACYGAIPLLLGGMQGDGLTGAELAWLAGFQAGLVMPIVLAKDYKDKTGDTATGKRTPLVRYGAALVRVVAVGLAFMVVASTIWAVPGSARWYCVVLGALYVSGVFSLHLREGKMAPLLRSALSLVMLVFSFILLHHVAS